MPFFEDFTLDHVNVDGGDIRLRYGGNGPPLLLLHGNPQTHAMWHRVAPALAERFRVVCPDLRGYGGSFKPEVTADHAPYAKKAMARDMVQVMGHFGDGDYFIGSHDRGARVAHRLALDFPDRVRKLAVLDIVPTIEHFERAEMSFAMGYYHWFWFAQRHPFPESVINVVPEVWFRAHTSREPKGDNFFHADALADYLAAVRDRVRDSLKEGSSSSAAVEAVGYDEFVSDRLPRDRHNMPKRHRHTVVKIVAEEEAWQLR